MGPNRPVEVSQKVETDRPNTFLASVAIPLLVNCHIRFAQYTDFFTVEDTCHTEFTYVKQKQTPKKKRLKSVNDTLGGHQKMAWFTTNTRC